MDFSEVITVTRDCEAVMIPYGAKVTLKKGDQVKITQALGSSYTVLFNGNLFRIDGQDSDAIGKEILTVQSDDNETGEFDMDRVWDVMRTCYDPEIPVNIVDLGLIYSCEENNIDGEGRKIEVKMTLTAPGCGMGGILADEVKNKVLGIPGVKDVNVELVWEPQWNQEMMSEAAKLHLGML